MAHQESYGLEAAGVLVGAVTAAFVLGTAIETVAAEALALTKEGIRDAIAAIIGCLSSHLRAILTHERQLSPTLAKVGVATDANRPSRLFNVEELPIALGFALINMGDFYKSV